MLEKLIWLFISVFRFFAFISCSPCSAGTPMVISKDDDTTFGTICSTIAIAHDSEIITLDLTLPATSNLGPQLPDHDA